MTCMLLLCHVFCIKKLVYMFIKKNCVYKKIVYVTAENPKEN